MIELQMVPHAIPAQLLCDVQNFEVINVLEFGWEQTEICIKFESRLKNRYWNGSLASDCTLCIHYKNTNIPDVNVFFVLCNYT